jgi:Transcription termination factor nusG
MARSDWAALLTEPAAEYTAKTELQRFGLEPYLPQLRKRHHTRPGRFVMRHYPLFPRYLLIPINRVLDPAVRMARGVCKHRPILADSYGQPWRAPQKIIEAIQLAEQRGDFDEILHKGDNVTLTYGVLATVRAVLATDLESPTGMVELLTPLFGGTKIRIDPSRIAHA